MVEISLKWQKIEDREFRQEQMYRTAVFGGWVVQSYQGRCCIGMIFVPDPNHEWDGKNVEVKPKSGLEPYALTKPEDWDDYQIYVRSYQTDPDPANWPVVLEYEAWHQKRAENSSYVPRSKPEEQ